MTTSGGETSAAMPHLMASAIGSKDVPLVVVDHGFYTSATYRMIDYFRNAGYNLKTYRSPLTPGEMERDYSGWCDPSSTLFSTVVRKIKHAPLNPSRPTKVLLHSENTSLRQCVAADWYAEDIHPISGGLESPVSHCFRFRSY